MPIDIKSQEMQFLLRQFEKGNVVLFAGAGFSIGATNRSGGDPPLGSALGKILADECGWEYTGEDLPVAYEQARKHLGGQALNALLFGLYRDCAPAPWRRQLARFFWYRIYTTNIDDVLEAS